MPSEYAIAWRDQAGIRRVGRLVLSHGEVVLDGTETSAPRRHARVHTDLAGVSSASVVGHGELPAVQIRTGAGTIVVELVAGGRGEALALVDELTSHPAA